MKKALIIIFALLSAIAGGAEMKRGYKTITCENDSKEDNLSIATRLNYVELMEFEPKEWEDVRFYHDKIRSYKCGKYEFILNLNEAGRVKVLVDPGAFDGVFLKKVVERQKPEVSEIIKFYHPSREYLTLNIMVENIDAEFNLSDDGKMRLLKYQFKSDCFNGLDKAYMVGLLEKVTKQSGCSLMKFIDLERELLHLSALRESCGLDLKMSEIEDLYNNFGPKVAMAIGKFLVSTASAVSFGAVDILKSSVEFFSNLKDISEAIKQTNDVLSSLSDFSNLNIGSLKGDNVFDEVIKTSKPVLFITPSLADKVIFHSIERRINSVFKRQIIKCEIRDNAVKINAENTQKLIENTLKEHENNELELKKVLGPVKPPPNFKNDNGAKLRAGHYNRQ